MAALRRMVVPIGILAAALLVVLFNPWLEIEEGTALRQVLTVAFWVTFIVLLVALFEDRNDPEATEVEIEGPRFARFLFSNTRAGLFWLPIRLFLGFAWVEAGWHKLTGWRLDRRGLGAGRLLGERGQGPRAGPPADQLRVVSRLRQLPDRGPPRDVVRAGSSPSARSPSASGLLFGALTGFAAFFGAFMNMSFLLAGSASTNPVLFTMAIGIILAWRVAGWYGLDRYLLPALGAPWRKGRVFGGQPVTSSAPG